MSGMKIDEWLPQHQVRARYSIVAFASTERTYEALTKASFADLPIIRGLMALRGYRLGGGKSPAVVAQTEGRRFGSFLELVVIPLVTAAN